MGLVGCTRLPAGAPPVPLRLLLLSACCAALLARGCVRAASTSAGPTSAHWYNASAHVLVSWSSCPLPVSCKPLADFDVTDHASGEHTDRERIVLCDGPLPGGRASARHTGSSSPPALAICVPVVFGRVSPAWLDDWLSWWTHLGASHATIYSMDVPEPRLANAVAANQLTWVDVSWLAAYDTHSHGQAWAMHDCLFRARTRGVRWAFFVDVDELLFIAAPGGSNATALLEAAAAASVRSLGTTGGNGSGSWRSANVVTFASVPYNTDVCDDDDSSSLPARMRFRAPSAECAPGPEDWDAKGWPRDTQCLGWAGRRKFAARVAEIDTSARRAAWPRHGNVCEA